MTRQAQQRETDRRSPRGLSSLVTHKGPRVPKRLRALAIAVSIAGHLFALLALVWPQGKAMDAPPKEVPPPPITVALVEGGAPAGPAASPEPPKPTTPKPPEPPKPPPQRRIPPIPPPPEIKPILASKKPTPEPDPDPVPEVSEAQLASATTAESGGGAGGGGAGGSGTGSGSGDGPGRTCNMIRRLQAALRSDPDIQAAIGQAHRAGGKAVVIWNGDWIRSTGQEGKGLAGVRQAIITEVAFAPEACRREPMRGLVLISMNDGPGSPRVVLGSGAWRWSDMLFVKSGGVAAAPR